MSIGFSKPSLITCLLSGLVFLLFLQTIELTTIQSSKHINSISNFIIFYSIIIDGKAKVFPSPFIVPIILMLLVFINGRHIIRLLFNFSLISILILYTSYLFKKINSLAYFHFNKFGILSVDIHYWDTNSLRIKGESFLSPNFITLLTTITFTLQLINIIRSDANIANNSQITE